ncbi:N-acetyl-gamma-glutamyl-phosphate reductase [Alkalibacter mobilis]|uniref:N-acetyl-gamma-glutamyl-phosphate reductase n=1 Tax=Alkalibacter mobilis TaxID=2787712 RepID=UPI0018A0D904|nr:N-acetyl-gamma-glutamyl-phosphate reductase [Alkalibacter mobilis]MBF7096517.1 N-acetyl-gamma-glutamyl-phosphate reductase [Alkalibacter mobilis]
MIRASVVGASGYVGQELIRLLIAHPEVEIVHVTSTSKVGEQFDDMYGNYRDIFVKPFVEQDLEKIAEDSDVIFLALPHGVASHLVTEELIKKVKVIDMGADYRLGDVEEYENWYKTRHESPQLIKKSIYGLCEIKKSRIKEYDLIANPGCYTTCSILTLAPVMGNEAFDSDSIVIDAKSGVSGAGRGLNLGTHYTECNESIKAYSVAAHRHTPEIEEQLSQIGGKGIRLLFTPHLAPMNRGILATCYIRLNEDMEENEIRELYNNYYRESGFVRILKEGILPETKWVKGSNYCDIGLKLDKRTNTLVAIGAIDNLVKGAAGQGIQNMNIIFGLDEGTGLIHVPIFPA